MVPKTDPGRQGGQVAVEFALLLPLLLLILIGILQFGRYFHDYLVITQAVREGARVGALGGSNATVQSRLVDSTATLTTPLTLGTIGSYVVLSPASQASRAVGQPFIVRINYPITLNIPFFHTTVTLPAQSMMRVENTPS